MGNAQHYNGRARQLGTPRSLRFSSKVSRRVSLYADSLPRSKSLPSPVKVHICLTESFDSQGAAGVVPLQLATDQEIMAELARRRVRVLGRMTDAFIQERYNLSAQPIGQGSSGQVFAATDRHSQRRLACKKVSRDGCMNDLHSMLTEVEILKRVRHRSIVEVVEIFETASCQWILMELVAGGTLRSHLATDGCGLPAEAAVARLTRQLLQAVQYLHSQGIVHRDIKVDNILIQPPHADLKLTDFGLSALCGTDCEGGFDGTDGMRRKRFRGLREPWGTPQGQAPEMLRGRGYGPQVDLWAAGCVLLLALTGTEPFRDSADCSGGQDDSERRILRGDYSAAARTRPALSAPALRLVSRLLQVDPVKRCGPAEALREAWLCDQGKPGLQGEQA